jgi:hypothetical protein
MRSGAQVLRCLVLLSVLVGLVGNSGSWDSIESSAQQQSQPPADTSPCNQQSGSTKIVGSADELQDAVDDPDCKVILVRGGFYIWPTEKHPYHLTIQRKNSLTIESLDPSRPRLIGLNPGQQTITIIAADKNIKITLQGLVIARKANFEGQQREGQSNIGILVTRSQGDIQLIDNLICGYTRAGISIDRSTKVKMQGNRIGISVDKKDEGICPEPENEVGVSIEDSTVEFIGNDVRGNKKDGVQISNSTVTILGSTVQGNKGDGIAITSTTAAEVTIEGTVISHNKGDGVQVTNSTLKIKQSEIFQNEGCGINIEGSSNVTDPQPQGRSNIIVANKNNFCPLPIPDSLATLRKFEATVPRHFSRIQQALDQTWLYPAEQNKAAGGFFTIYVQSGTYNENICIPRSVRLQALGDKGQVKLQGDSSQPVIGIGSDNCTGSKSLEGPADHNITIDGFEISGGSVGVQVGPGPQSTTKLQIILKNLLITSNKSKGLWIIGDGNDDLNIQIAGEQAKSFSDVACNIVDLRNPNFQQLPSDVQKKLGSLYQVATAKIDNNGDDGITIDARDQATVTVALSQVIIGGDIVADQKLNKGNGIFLKSTSEMPVQLQLNSVWVARNSKRGLEVELGGEAPNVAITITGSSLYRNSDSGLKVTNQTISQNLELAVVDTHVTGNGGHGVELFGQLQAILTTTEPTSDKYCGLFANKKSGLRAELGPDIESPPGSGIKTVVQAQVQIDKLRIEKNEEGVLAKNLTSFRTFYALQLSNSQISENNRNGLLLESRIANRNMNVLINGNLFRSNKLWGVTKRIRSCLIDHEEDLDSSYFGVIKTEVGNTFEKNGSGLSEREKPAGYDGQVCPKDLESLIKK